MITRLLACALIVLVGLTACKKKSNVSPSPTISLDSLSVSGKTVTLKWTGPLGDSQQNYLVYRYSDTTRGPDTIFHLDKNTKQYIDTLTLPPLIIYKVVAQFSKSTATSNSRSYATADIKFIPFTPTDVLFDKTAHQLYLFHYSGKIVVYDIPSKKVVSQATGSSFWGYGDLAIHNGVKELYIPQSNGKVAIYNAGTLTRTDSIDLESSVASVVYNNGLLFINPWASDSGVKVYNRSTKQKIAQTPWGMPYRIKLVPGTSSEFYGVDVNFIAYYFQFNSSGNYIAQQYSYNFPYENVASAMAIFPDGSKMISSTYGYIFDRNLNYLASLPNEHGMFTCFEFDTANQVIYAGVLDKYILSYSMSDYHVINSISTQGHPLFIFYDNGSIISVSSTQESSYSNLAASFIEQF